MLLETSKLLKEYGRGYRRVYNQAFNDFPKNVGFNTGLSAPQPDMIEGLDLREFKPFPVRQELGGAAIPTSENNAITLPHLAGEWKAGGKDMIQARTQAAYDGACMVYGRNKARSFLNKPDPTGCAYVHTFTTDGTTLNTYAHYSFKSEGQVQYHQYPTSSSFLISSFEDFEKSRLRLRNLQDDAEETSKKLRDELNKEWLANHRFPVAPSVPAETADPKDRTSFPTNDQYNSYEQIPATDNVYAPPSASLQEINQDESFVQIPAPSYTIFPPNDEDKPFTQVSTANNGYTSPDGPTFSPVTPPQSEDTSLPLESREDIDQSNGRGHKRIRRT
jgi:hypothetical protein